MVKNMIGFLISQIEVHPPAWKTSVPQVYRCTCIRGGLLALKIAHGPGLSLLKGVCMGGRAPWFPAFGRQHTCKVSTPPRVNRPCDGDGVEGWSDPRGTEAHVRIGSPLLCPPYPPRAAGAVDSAIQTVNPPPFCVGGGSRGFWCFPQASASAPGQVWFLKRRWFPPPSGLGGGWVQTSWPPSRRFPGSR